MKIIRFFAATHREVMREVRQALGPDALIISSRSIDGGVEIMATDPSAIDDDGNIRVAEPGPSPAAQPADAAPARAPAPAFAPQPGYAPQPPRPVHAAPAVHASQPMIRPAVAAAAPAPDPEPRAVPAARISAAAPAYANDDATYALVDEDAGHTPDGAADMAQVTEALNALRGALETRIDGLMWGKGLSREPVPTTLFRTLMEAGFSAGLIRAMLSRLPPRMSFAAALSWARSELISHLPVMGQEEELFGNGGVFALVGPTGVGKTTTLAKLAARCVARVGREQVAMLTTDNFRIGAHEQLQIYGRLMGVPTRSVRDVEQLRQTLAELGARKIILIDTTGISQRDRHVAEQAAMLCGAGRPVQRLVVLNAASQGDTLDEVAHAYRNGADEDVRGCIITKVDEASRYAAALDTAIRHRLPIHYVSRGQRVPEHLDVPTAAELVDGAFACLRRPALYTPSEADLAALWSASRDQAGGQIGMDPVRRRQLLASAMLRPQGAAADVEGEMEAALAWINTDPACVQAREMWRGLSGERPVATGDLVRRPLDTARAEFPATCSRHLLALHGQIGMVGQGMPGGTLMTTLLLSDRGAALGAPAQQLSLDHGVVSSIDATPPARLNAADALAGRAAWLQAELKPLPVVHLLAAGTAALWQSLSAQGLDWLSRSVGAFRVIQDETPTTLQAIGKTLGYVPVGEAGDMVGLTQVQGDAAVPLRLWAAGTEVQLAGRGADPMPVRLVCAKLIGPSGRVTQQVYGLTNVGVAQADAATVARWLVLHDHAKSAFRYMAHAWQPLSGSCSGDDAMLRQTLMAGQLGAACWQLAHAPSAAVMRRLLQTLMGPERKLPARLVPPALLRFFAMVEMAGEGGRV
ncbi:flagellar biosynthesis protein FlhF [Bordetella genomosp. 9]|uniref:Flagellar biosynthesis protein FlhF n=2 Tax=Bordetella genomosp. 9 TaxID=1416803 RepID=A0A1W6Z191_9BORD|nr:flagellar biosynthesis protein FlhF [Bordetella genomosp. 9]ARP86954.1 flagellar biosynthesis protein FlhF [Bordetella genomosp. 9]